MGPISKRVREETGLPVASALGLAKQEIAESNLQNEEMDIVMVGCSHLASPNWTFEAAKALGVDLPSWDLPVPYAHWLQSYE